MLNFQISDIFLTKISEIWKFKASASDRPIWGKNNAVFRLDLRILLFINCIAISNFGSHRGMYHVGPHCGACQCDMKHHQHKVLHGTALSTCALFQTKVKNLEIPTAN